MASITFDKIKIKDFGIKNFRSIGEDSEFINDLKKLNLFIGKNNSGKSNILKFINLVSNSQTNMAFPSNLENQHRRNGNPASILFRLTHSQLSFPLKFSSPSSYGHGTEFKDFKKILPDPLIFDYNLKDKILTIDGLDKLNDHGFNEISNHYEIGIRGSDYLTPIKEFFKTRLVKNVLLEQFKNVIYIPDLRFIKEGVSIGSTNTEINGSNIISEMFKMQNPNIGEESKRDQFEKIVITVRDLLNIKDLFIEIPHTKDIIIINLNGTRLPLEYFGTGIHELVILCSALIIHNNHLVCLEEPEIHLHPELQKKFFNFLLSTSNSYFITTHSNSFLDFSNENVSIYHVNHIENKSSISRADTNKSASNIITDLGYKTSDLLQANGIIWVEGPSDRIYLNKWLSLKKVTFVEGIHFSIMFYGGKLLSHLNFDIDYLEKELLNMCRINRNSFIMIDSDITKSRKKINETKQRIQEEIGDNFWITKGKEIENYLSEKSLINWINSKNGNNPSLNSLKLENDINQTLKFLKNPIDYQSSKTKFAKEIISFIDKEDLKVQDLNKQIDKIVSCINNWNT